MDLDLVLLAVAALGILTSLALHTYTTGSTPAPYRRRRRTISRPPADLHDQEPPGLEAVTPIVRCPDCGFPLHECGCNYERDQANR